MRVAAVTDEPKKKEKKELSEQQRLAIALVLALVVYIGWMMMYKPPTPPVGLPGAAETGGSASGTSSTGLGATGLGATGPGGATGANGGSATPSTVQAAPAPAGAIAVPVVNAPAEQTIVVESDLYRVTLSNRGGVVRSWQLKKFTDAHTPPRTLDIVNADLAQQIGAWPFSLQTNDAQVESAVNQGLYVVQAPGAAAGSAAAATVSLTAPAEVDFHWSDGQTDVTKRLKFDASYVVSVETSLQRNGQEVAHRLAWRGGFGDIAAFRAAVQMTAFDSRAGSVTLVATKNLGDANNRSQPAEVPGGPFDTVGIEDLYFAAAFLPPEPPVGQAVSADLTLGGGQVVHAYAADGKAQQDILPEMSAGVTGGGPVDLRVFVGPKDLDTLKAVRPPLDHLVQFGWTGFIAEPLFYTLRWVHRYIPNYGWTIVLMTIAINMVLYPLKVKSWRSMQKMQKVAPEVRQIQDRYKKYSMRDPRKAEMNKEVMAVYSREGINPMGSCLPTVAQLPIWWGLYRMLTYTIELRHAPWIGWIHDLSARDPYYILPIAMALVMWGVQKMTPMTVSDPSQQRMMALMPIMFGGMFIIFPIASGLVLYIFTSNLIAMAQQWYLNRTSPLKPAAAGRGGKAKK